PLTWHEWGSSSPQFDGSRRRCRKATLAAPGGTAETKGPGAMARPFASFLAWKRLFGGAFPGDFLAALLVDDLHGEAHLAALVEAEQFYPHLVAFLDHVGGLGDALVGQLGNMDQPVLGAEEVDERAEIGGLDHGALVDMAHFRLVGDRADPLDGRLDLAAVRGRDLHRAVVLDIDLGDGLVHALADDPAAGADHVADLVGGNLEGLDARGELAHLAAALGDRLGHLAQDVGAAVAGLGQGDLHDLLGDTGDLDV